MKRLIAAILCVCMLVPGAALAQDDPIEEMLLKAYELAYNGASLQAMAYVEMASRMNETDLRPTLMRAYVYLCTGGYEQALEIVDGVIGKNPIWQEAWAMRWRIDLASGDADAAKKDMAMTLACGDEQYTDLQEQMKALEESMPAAEEAAEEAAEALTAQTDAGSEAEAVETAEAIDADAYLDAIVASGSAKLTKTKFAGRSMLAMTGINENLVPISISPDGKTALVSMFGALTIMNETAQIPVLPLTNRGVPDEYGNRAKMLSAVGVQHGRISVVWSPDGRYAAMINPRTVMTMARFEWDPLVIDLQTGEAFLPETTPSKFGNGSGAAIAACFSRDGRYFYYALYGGGYEERYSILRYDLESGEKTLCYNGAEHMYCAMWELPDGSLAINGSLEQHLSTGAINVYREENGVWRCKQYPFNLENNKWMMEIYEADYSAASNTFLAMPNNAAMQAATISSLRIAQMDENIPGREVEWILRDGETPKLECMAPWTYEATDEFIVSCMKIVRARLSPGGRYVLAAVRGARYDGFVLLDLENKTVTPVEAPEGVTATQVGLGEGTRGFEAGFLWGDDGTLLMYTENGLDLFVIE